MSTLKRTFWDGIKAFVPIALTVGIVLWLLNSLENFFGQFIRYFIPPEYYFKGLGILLGIIFIYFIGLLVNAWFTKWIYGFADQVVQKIPGVKTIYNAIQDLVNFFDKSAGASQQQVVLVNSAIGQMLGFVTRDSVVGTPLMSGEDKVLVYIPLSYQIGGMTLAVRQDDLVPINCSADEAMSFILTAGMTTTRKKN